jgi:pimeloyl-ACP methyl ester carboxylesterase
VRPGYPDGEGAFSSGSDNARSDNWQRQTIIEIVAAIESLRQRFKPPKIILVGHSGGAAIAAVILGMQPQLAQAAVLLACPCDMVAWRAGRRGPPWASEDPLKWAHKVAPSVKVLALTGDRDDTTSPELARTYVQRLKGYASDGVFEVVPNVGHIDLLRGSVPVDAVARILHPGQ